MIEVRHLTKRYGVHAAVSDLSFTIDRGMIYGFLGPNGAGKSTTMNMITGCLGATDGEVLIDGHSIMEEPMQAKRLIGYLPEQPPLYTDMTPEEYLRFVLKAKGVARRDWDVQLKTVMEKTRIEDVKDRLIRNLSKGYRQRVGIAQALLGNPEVIILDEPTVGLDPKQIIEIRSLIQELGHGHTIVLSSHILSEVQAVCDSIMILSKGKLVASDTAENLTALFADAVTLSLETRATAEEAQEILKPIQGLESVEAHSGEDGITRISAAQAQGVDAREALSMAFAQAGKPLLELHSQRASLEDVFLELTQGEAGETAAEPAGKEATGK